MRYVSFFRNRQGIIDDVDAIFGMHCTPLLDVGQMGIIDGPAMAAVDAFRITFHGKGVHAYNRDVLTDEVRQLFP